MEKKTLRKGDVRPSRRQVIGGAAALFGGMGLLGARASWGATNTAPEVADLRFGIIALTFPAGTHAMWIRYWLAAVGINPDKDVALIVVPPAQMVANMKVGKMDGFCVGEPWNARVIADGIGYTATNTQDIWKDHPEKVCAFTAEFAEKNPRTVKAVLKALQEASAWLDDMSNRP